MKLTRKARKKLARKLKANSTQENLLTRAFQNQVKKQLIERLKKATSEEEVDEIINGFSIAPLSQRIMNLSNSTFNSSADEFRTIVDAFIHNPKNVYLNLRAEGMLKNKTDFEPFMRAYRHNLSLIKDLPRDLAKGMKSSYMRGTSFRGTAFAEELYSRLGKRARVIIRTESAKISSTLTQARMQKIGLNAYIWSTSEDSRVRSAHALLDGVLFFWNDPPTIDNYQDHCGRFINCRCIPVPVTYIDDIRFPIKVAQNLNIQTKWVKGGKGKIDTTIVGGFIKKYSKEEFLSEFGSKFV